MTATLFDEQPDPIRPYWQDGQPSAGWSGSDTSKASEPARLTTQQRAWLHARDTGRYGVTWREVSDRLGVHHGTASGALSALHKAGHLARLTTARHGCKVYVLPSLISGRDTEPPTMRPTRREQAHAAWSAALAMARTFEHSVADADAAFEKWWASQD